MPEKEEARKQQQMMGLLGENQSWGLSNSDEKLSSMDPPPIIGSSSNYNDLLLLQQKEKDEGNNVDGGKTTSSKRSRGGRRSTGSTNGEGEDGKGVGGGESDDHEIHIWTERQRRKKMRNMFANLHALLPQLPSKADKSTIVDEAVNYIKSLQNTLQKLQKQKLERLQQLQSASTTFVYDPSVNINYQWHPYESREAFMADQGSSINNSSTKNNLATTNAITIGTSNPSTSLSVPRINNNPVEFQTWTSSNVVLNICGDQAQFSVCSPKMPGLFTSICFVLDKHKIEVLSAHVSSDNNQSMYMIQAQANRASNQFQEAFSVEETFRQAAGEIMLWLS